MEVNFREFGEKGKNIVFLHGWQQDGRSFLPLTSYFYQNYKIYLPDLPGFGKTPAPVKAFSSEDYAETIVSWMDKIEINSSIVVGHSFGGKVASLLAYCYPGRVEKLVLIAASGIPQGCWWYPLAARLPRKIKDLLKFLPLGALRSRDYQNAGALLPTFKKIVKEDLRPVFPDIHQPTLVIWGKEDKEVPLKNGQEINKLLPNSELKVVPGGHFPFWQDAEGVSSIIKQFIAG